MNEILKIEGLSKTFTKKGFFNSNIDTVKAVNDVTFSLDEGEILAIAGQSGSGKSTIAKLILRAIELIQVKSTFQVRKFQVMLKI